MQECGVHLSDWGQRQVPAVVSMGMNFWFPRFGVIPQLAVQILSSQGGFCIMGKTIIAVSLYM
jgi:hypothetical protein